jgi:transcriptional regulator with XRE-family HTH domain
MDERGLARRLGVSLKTIQSWEHDQREPASNRLQMLAGLLNVSIVWFLTGRGATVPQRSDPDADLTRQRAIAQEIVSLKDELVAASARLARIETQVQGLL